MRQREVRLDGDPHQRLPLDGDDPGAPGVLLASGATSSSTEAGVLVRGGPAPRRAAEHVAHLVAAGVLVRLHPDETA